MEKLKRDRRISRERCFEWKGGGPQDPCGVSNIKIYFKFDSIFALSTGNRFSASLPKLINVFRSSQERKWRFSSSSLSLSSSPLFSLSFPFRRVSICFGSACPVSTCNFLSGESSFPRVFFFKKRVSFEGGKDFTSNRLGKIKACPVIDQNGGGNLCHYFRKKNNTKFSVENFFPDRAFFPPPPHPLPPLSE